MMDLEALWAGLLSRDSDTVLETWHALNSEEQAAVYAHLKRMTTEDGWSEPQRISAQAALDALDTDDTSQGG
ncbi:MAG: hypothetical protein GYB65_09905 [Chloroflexi bacterium]|nr:hypothetical protein [Chloroflexota bacterium]